MSYSRPSLLLLPQLLLCLVIRNPIIHADLLYHVCSDRSGNYTTNDTYHGNLTQILSSLPASQPADYGFPNFLTGAALDNGVRAIGLCSGDVDTDTCRRCIRDAGRDLLRVCPNQKEAIGWNNTCMLRYSSRSIFGVMEDCPAFSILNTTTVKTQIKMNSALSQLLDNLRSHATSGNSSSKFAAGSVRVVGAHPTIFGMVQCTPDLSQIWCNTCLEEAAGEIPSGRDINGGWRIFRPSCSIRYELNKFYRSATADALVLQPGSPPRRNNVTSPLSPRSNSTTFSSGRKKWKTIVIIVVPTVTVLLILVSSFIWWRKSRKKVETNENIRDVELFEFNLNTISTATDSFSCANKLGQGGFGVVYKGKLVNGVEIAVKRLSVDSEQGEQEFKNEVVLLAKLQHKNLVRLMGFCLEKTERLLIYEFVPNASLNKFVFEKDAAKRARFNWEMRLKIIKGVARGLLYLHEDSRLKIIHRDLKASNILLDAKMNPKISDFGMARIFALDQTQDNTKRIVGTPGYMAPEYYNQGHISTKSDVFSFGVLILEIMSGQKTHYICFGENEENLLTHAWKHWTEGTTLKLVDSALGSGSRTEIIRCIHIGLLCVQANGVDRPTMASVVNMLSSSTDNLPEPSQPAFYMYGSAALATQNNVYKLDGTRSAPPSSINELSVTEVGPR